MSGYYKYTGLCRVEAFDTIWEVVNTFGKMKLMTMTDRVTFMHRLETRGVEAIGYEGRGEAFEQRVRAEKIEHVLDVLVKMRVMQGWQWCEGVFEVIDGY
jgi:hypothetical protein